MAEIRLVAPVDLTMQGQKIVDLGIPTEDTDGARFADLPNDLVDLDNIVPLPGPDGNTVVTDSAGASLIDRATSLYIDGDTNGTLGDIRLSISGSNTLLTFFSSTITEQELRAAGTVYLQDPNDLTQFVEIDSTATTLGQPLINGDIFAISIPDFDFSVAPDWAFVIDAAAEGTTDDFIFQFDDIILSTGGGTQDGTIATTVRLHSETFEPYIVESDVGNLNLQGVQGRYTISIYIDVTDGGTPAEPADSSLATADNTITLPADDADYGAWSLTPPASGTVIWESRAEVNPADFAGDTYVLNWSPAFEAGAIGARGEQGFQGDSTILLNNPLLPPLPGEYSELIFRNFDVNPVTGVSTGTNITRLIAPGGQGDAGESLEIASSDVDANNNTVVNLQTVTTMTDAGSFTVNRGLQGPQGLLNVSVFLGQGIGDALPVRSGTTNTTPTGNYFTVDSGVNNEGDVIIAEPVGWVDNFAEALVSAGGSAAVTGGTGVVYQSNFTINPATFVTGVDTVVWIGTTPFVTGLQGPPGDNGFGVAAGGFTGNVLTKIDDSDYATQWTALDTTPTENSTVPVTSGGVFDVTRVDQAYQGTSTNAQSGVAIQGRIAELITDEQVGILQNIAEPEQVRGPAISNTYEPDDLTDILGTALAPTSTFITAAFPAAMSIELTSANTVLDSGDITTVQFAVTFVDTFTGTETSFTFPDSPTALDTTFTSAVDVSGLTPGTEYQTRLDVVNLGGITALATRTGTLTLGGDDTTVTIRTETRAALDALYAGGTADLTQLNENPLNYAASVSITEGSVVSWEEDGDPFLGIADEIQHSSTIDNITTTGTEVTGRFPSVLLEEVPVADYTDWITADADTIPNHLILQELEERGRTLVVEIVVADTVDGSTDQFRDVIATVVEERIPSTTTGQVERYTVTPDSAAEITAGGSWNIIELSDVYRALTHIIQNADETINVTSDITVGRQLLVGNIGSSIGGAGFQIHVSDDAPFDATTSAIIAVGAFEATFGVADRRDIEDAVAALETGERLYFVLDTVPVTPNGVISDEEGAVFVFDSITNVNTVNFSRVDGITAESASPGNNAIRTFTFFSGIETEPNTVLITDNLEVFRDTTFDGPVTFTNTVTGLTLTTNEITDFEDRVGIITNPASVDHTRLQHEITIVGNTTVDSTEDYTAPAVINDGDEIDVRIRMSIESFSSQAGVIHVDLIHQGNTVNDITSIATFDISDIASLGAVTVDTVIDGDDLRAGDTYDVSYRTVGHGDSSTITFLSNVDFAYESGGLFIKPEVDDYLESLIESYSDGTRQDLHTNYLTGAEIAAHYLSGNIDHAEGTLALIAPFEPDNTNFQSDSDAYISDGGDRIQVTFAFNEASVREQDFHNGRIFLIQFNDGAATATFSQVYRARVYFNNPGFPGSPVEIYANLIDDNNELINPLSAVSDTDATTVLAALTALSNGVSSGNALFDAGQVELSLDLSVLPSIFESTLGVEVPSLNGFLPQGGTFASKFTLFFGTPSAGTEVTVTTDTGDVLRTPEIYTTSGRDWYWWSDLIITDTTISIATENAGLWTSTPDPDDTGGVRFNLIG